MDERGSVPPGLPRPNPTTSYWQDPPDEIADLRSTADLPEAADIVIIGSGISGSCIAHNVLEATPGCKIVMLEARQAASGASGRNGGHTKGASYRSFHENVKLVGEENAIRIARLEYDCMVAVHDFIREQGIKCDSRRLDTVDVFYDESQLQRAQVSVALMRKLMGDELAAKYKFWSAEETASKFLCPSSLGSVTYEAGSLSAYKLTIGVLKLALGNGLNLQCNTAASAVKRLPGKGGRPQWAVVTGRGIILTDKVVLATNGYTAHLYPALQGVIVPFRGIITAQRPGRKLPQTGLETSYSFIYDTGYEYMIARPQGSKHEGDIIIGGGLTKAIDGGLEEYGQTDDVDINPEIVKYLTDSTTSFFGKNWGEDHPDGRVRRAWSGVMGYSGDGYPLVGPIPGDDGLFIDASFQGHGMVLCFLCAKAAAAMILGEGEEEIKDWFPEAYRATESRMKLKFKGRINAPKAMEVSQNGAK